MQSIIFQKTRFLLKNNQQNVYVQQNPFKNLLKNSDVYCFLLEKYQKAIGFMNIHSKNKLLKQPSRSLQINKILLKVQQTKTIYNQNH